MPIFFGTRGLQRRPHHPGKPDLAAADRRLILIASLGKFAGAFAGAMLGGLRCDGILALGCGMNARGSTEVIVASIGLSMGALEPEPLHHDRHHGGDHHHGHAAHAALGARRGCPCARRKSSGWNARRWTKGFVPKLERLLLAVDDSASGKFASRIAGLLAGTAACRPRSCT